MVVRRQIARRLGEFAELLFDGGDLLGGGQVASSGSIRGLACGLARGEGYDGARHGALGEAGRGERRQAGRNQNNRQGAEGIHGGGYGACTNNRHGAEGLA